MNRQTFGSLIRDCDHELRGVVWSVVRSATDTDDVMQVAYEKAFRTLDEFRGDASFTTWMHTICYRAALDHLKFEARRDHEPAEVLDSHAAPGSTSDTAIERIELAEVLAQLDVESRALLMLTAGLGYSFDETAAIVDLPRGTVASRVSRARQRLRRD